MTIFRYDKLKEARKQMPRSWMIIELSKRGISVTEQTLMAWEMGRTIPDSNILAVIADITKKPIKFFFEAA